MNTAPQQTDMYELKVVCQRLLGRKHLPSDVEMLYAVDHLGKILSSPDASLAISQFAWISPLCQAILTTQLTNLDSTHAKPQRTQLELALGIIAKRVSIQGTSSIHQSAVTTEGDVIDFVLREIPDLKNKLYEGECLQAALRLKHFVATNTLEAPIEFIQEPENLGEIFRKFWDRTGGTWCSGAAKVLSLLLAQFNIPSITYNYGLQDTDLTHVVTILYAEDKKFYVVDPYFSLYYADTETWIPISFNEMLQRIRADKHSSVRRVFEPFTRSRLWNVSVKNLSDTSFEPYQISQAERVSDTHTVMPYKYPNERQIATRLVEKHCGDMQTEDFYVDMFKNLIGRDSFLITEIEQEFTDLLSQSGIR